MGGIIPRGPRRIQRVWSGPVLHRLCMRLGHGDKRCSLTYSGEEPSSVKSHGVTGSTLFAQP